MTASTEDAARAALFGKLPCARDFLRENHDHRDSSLLERWLQASLQRLAARGQSWPEGCQHFVLAPPPERSTIVGVVAASRDRAGRRFPVAIYTRLVSPRTAALPLAYRAFMRAAQATLDVLGSCASDELAPALRRLPIPNARDLRVCEAQLARALSTHSLDVFSERLFGAGGTNTALRAWSRLLDANAPYLDLPVQSELDVAIWARGLELARGKSSSCLWQAGDDASRLLLVSGSMPERAISHWAGRDQSSLLEEAAPPLAANGGETSLAACLARWTG